jgi:hypothetical protein
MEQREGIFTATLDVSRSYPGRRADAKRTPGAIRECQFIAAIATGQPVRIADLYPFRPDALRLGELV